MVKKTSNKDTPKKSRVSANGKSTMPTARELMGGANAAAVVNSTKTPISGTRTPDGKRYPNVNPQSKLGRALSDPARSVGAQSLIKSLSVDFNKLGGGLNDLNASLKKLQTPSSPAVTPSSLSGPSAVKPALSKSGRIGAIVAVGTGMVAAYSYFRNGKEVNVPARPKN